MKLERVKAARRHNGAASGIALLTSVCTREDTENLPQVQSAFLTSRFGLSADRARVVAELAWGRP